MDNIDKEKLRVMVQKIMARSNLHIDDYDIYRKCACEIVNKMLNKINSRPKGQDYDS
jgi:hypothetical protein